MKPIRVAVVGVGHLGKEHARIYAEMEEAELVGVVDRDAKQARRVARKCKTRILTGLQDVIDKVDAVSIAVPTVDHLSVARPFLERGVSVLVEKPLAGSVADAEVMVDLAGRSGSRLQVGHIERFNPAFQAVLDMGFKPVFVESHRMSPFRFRSVDIGVVFDLMIHDLDIIQHLVGADIEHIDAAGANVISPHEDIASVRLSFANGCVANITASRVSVKSMRKIRLFAKDSYVSIDTEAQEVLVYRKKPGFEEAARKLREANANMLAHMKALAFGELVGIEKLRIDEAEPLKRELESFVECVREGKPPAVPGEDGLRAVQTAARILDDIDQRLRRMGWR